MKMGARLIDEGKLHLPVSATYPLVAAKEAFAHAQRGGKVLLKLSLGPGRRSLCHEQRDALNEPDKPVHMQGGSDFSVCLIRDS